MFETILNLLCFEDMDAYPIPANFDEPGTMEYILAGVLDRMEKAYQNSPHYTKICSLICGLENCNTTWGGLYEEMEAYQEENE